MVGVAAAAAASIARSRQVIDGARQSVRSLDEQFEPLILEGIGMNTDSAKPCSNVVTGLCRLKPSEGQGKAEP